MRIQSTARLTLGLTITVLVIAAFAGNTDKIGTPAPPFVGTTLTGESIHLSNYEGKVVLLDFWASWCGPCREEMPFLIDLYDDYHEAGLDVLTINIDDHTENAQAFLDELGEPVPFPVLFDPDKHVPALYEIEAMPTAVLIDKKGIVRYWHDGFKTSHQSQYRQELTTLLNTD